jgi:hypothetical protein
LLETLDGRLTVRTLIKKYSSVHEQEEYATVRQQFEDSKSLLDWRDQALLSSSESEGEEPASAQREPMKPATRTIAKQAAPARSAPVRAKAKKAKPGKKRR